MPPLESKSAEEPRVRDGQSALKAGLCCSSPVMSFWLAVFFVLWGSTLMLELWIPVLDLYSTSLLLASAGVACITTFALYRPFHCAITGPLFLLAAGALALEVDGLWQVNLSALWPLLLIAIGVSLLLERHFAR
ncbi:MAG: hypothetical protein ACE5JI_06725 [Acidobacteriota bacterium]